MQTQQVSKKPSCYSNRLLDALMGLMELKNDATLARKLGISPSRISKIRHGYLTVSASLLLQIHEITGIQIRQLRTFMEQGCQPVPSTLFTDALANFRS